MTLAYHYISISYNIIFFQIIFKIGFHNLCRMYRTTVGSDQFVRIFIPTEWKETGRFMAKTENTTLKTNICSLSNTFIFDNLLYMFTEVLKKIEN